MFIKDVGEGTEPCRQHKPLRDPTGTFPPWKNGKKRRNPVQFRGKHHREERFHGAGRALRS